MAAARPDAHASVRTTARIVPRSTRENFMSQCAAPPPAGSFAGELAAGCVGAPAPVPPVVTAVDGAAAPEPVVVVAPVAGAAGTCAGGGVGVGAPAAGCPTRG